MIRVTVELVPFGDESQARQIGEMLIANVDYSHHDPTRYVVVTNDDELGISKRNTFHHRYNSFWTLVSNAINSTTEIATYWDNEDANHLEQKLSDPRAKMNSNN